MKTIIKALSASAIATFIFSTSVTAQEEKPAAPTQEELQQVSNEFEQLLKQGIVFKDKDALRIAKLAQENDGKLTMTLGAMMAQITKWKTNSITVRFQKLLKEKVVAKDTDAVAFMAKITEAKANNEQFKMTPDEMIALVQKWESVKVEEAPVK